MEEEIVKKEISTETQIIGEELKIKKEDVLKFFKQKGKWVYSLIFAIIAFIGIYVRVLNIPKLKDITTGTWTLGPDLDPFLFLRWAQYIVAHGKLFVLDAMRSVPLANICSGAVQCAPVATSGETRLLPYMIAELYKFLSVFSKTVTVNYAAVIFPVIMFALTIIAFFLFARKVFYKLDKNKRNIIALISTALFVLVPSLLPRTIAGIPEKESAGFFFIFLSLYFFLEAYSSEKLKRGIIFSVLSGISTGLLGLIWGGVNFIFVTIPAAVLFAFLIGKVSKKEFFIYTAWIPSFIIASLPFSERFTLENLLVSTTTEMSFVVFFILLIDFLIFHKKIFNIHERIKKIKLPKEVISTIIAIILVIVLMVTFFGPSLLIGNIGDFISNTIHPLVQTRFSVTVAENAQPYFIGDWTGEFGPSLLGIPIFFWLFFIGSVFLFNFLIQPLGKKEKRVLTFSYLVFLFCLIFSKYSSSSILNGESWQSMFVYFGGALFFILSFVYVYLKRYKNGEFSIFKELNFSYIIYFLVLTVAIIAARGAVRLVMVLGAIAPVAIGFLVFKISDDFFKEKEDTKKFFLAVAAILVIIGFLFTVWSYYQSDKINGENYAPGVYQWQWQKAMAWVRDNTPTTAVFAHWWDYGYWVQTIGERATVLDGGNAIGYWDYLMGRDVLTSPDENIALQFLYTHNTTNLLIDSTDIGKYSAFSSIGSNASYDRFSWINSFLVDDKLTQETKDSKVYIYTGGTANDQDITWNINGTEVFLPSQGSAVVGIALQQNTNGGFSQPSAIFQYNNAQYSIPLRYAYINGNLTDFQTGLDAGIFVFPELSTDTNGSLGVNKIGALFYLSPRTIHSQLAQLYLFDQESNYFKLAHTESDPLIEDLRKQGVSFGEFAYYQGFRGPIKIWSITYPSGIKANPDFLSLDYPSDLQGVNPSQYG
jgi:asparagine N-glycosylation enzyme membrane subunit Stt3